MKRKPVYKRLLRIEIALIVFLLLCILLVKSCFQHERRERLQQTQQEITLTQPVVLPEEPPLRQDQAEKSVSPQISTDFAQRHEGFSSVEEAAGFASYYQDAFHGQPTASGERYDLTQYTAAHRELPFGTEVRVTNIANGKQVTVRINDRGPDEAERIIDLSGQAARAIDLFEAGIAQVKLEVLK